MSVQVYAMGAFMCSVCAPAEMNGPAVAAEVQAGRPAGTEHGWQVAADSTFKSGEPNPCNCDSMPGRRHWLLEC